MGGEDEGVYKQCQAPNLNLKIVVTQPLTSPVQQPLDSETLMADAAMDTTGETTGDFLVAQSVASTSARSIAPPSSDQLASASSTAPSSPEGQEVRQVCLYCTCERD
jgi:hypothetical protein